MADPFGGGRPFGEGPFGPTPEEEAAATESRTVSIDGPIVRFGRTLFYQSTFFASFLVVAANTVVGSGFYVPLAKATERPPSIAQRQFTAFVPQPPVVAAAQVTASVTTSAATAKSLFYQSKVYALAPPAAADNNITGIAWHQPSFQQAPPKTRPPLSASDLRQFAVPEERFGVEWLRPFSAPSPALQPLAFGPVYSPKAPEAVAAVEVTSTVIIDGPRVQFQRTLQYQAKAWCPQPIGVVVNTRTEWDWHIQWKGPPRYQPPKVLAQPFIPVSAAPNLTTSIEWLQKWQGPPNYNPAPAGGSPFVPTAQIVERVTPDKWLMRWQGPPRYRPIKVQTPPFVPKEAVLENTQTPNKWLFRFQKAVPGRPVTHTQPFFGYPYQDVFVTGGPADEPERVVCVLASSRVAVVPELARVVEPLPGDTIISSNVFEDIPCAPFGNVAGLPIIQSVILLEDGSSRLLLENGTYLLLEDD